jgi:hypothetical protein
MHKLVHGWGQDRLGVEQERHLSLIALELLTDIIPSTAGKSDLRNATSPTCHGELCCCFRHNYSISDHS